MDKKKVMIIGLGVSGRAAASFLLKRGAQVVGVDRDRDLLLNHMQLGALRQQGLQVCHESEPLEIETFDLVIASPGVPQSHPLYSAARSAKRELIGEVELACRYIKERSFGITGSNGKTTTTLLVAHVLNLCGQKARALGNIGVPLTAAIETQEPGETLVVELSSWQLETMGSSVFDAGLILNITPNHLDRHGTMEQYAEAKLRLKVCLKQEAPFFMGYSCAPLFKGPVKTIGFDSSCFVRSDGSYVYLDGKKAFSLPSQYQGKATHDVENLMAAYALCHTSGVRGEEFLIAFSSFRKPPHRIEFVKKIAGVAYYDDSKATSIDAVQKAISSLTGTIHLIAGGVHKGASYESWRQPFEGRVRGIYAIGQAANQIDQDLGNFFPVQICSSLEEAVKSAAVKAKEGENVLLSPGCASYDMFKDYNHRGDAFQRLVQELGMKQ